MDLASGCWTRLGLRGHEVREVAATPSGIYVGTRSGQVFRLAPDRRWREVGLPAWRGRLFVNALVFSPTTPPRLFAGISSDYPDDTTRAVVYVSEDLGETWAPSDGGLAAGFQRPYEISALSVQDMAVAAGDPNHLLMSNPHGVLRSLDAGDTWEYVLAGPDFLPADFRVLLTDPLGRQTIWSGGASTGEIPRVLRSDDLGETWHAGFPRCRWLQDTVMSMALDPNVPGRLWMGTIHGILWADNGGETEGSWRCAMGEPTGVVGLGSIGRNLYAVTMRSETIWDQDGHFVENRFSPGPVFRTADGGNVWEPLDIPDNLPIPYPAVAVDAERGELLIGTSDGLWSLKP